MGKVQMSSKARVLLTLESVFSDAIVVVVAIILMRILSIPAQGFTVGIFAREVVGSTVIGVIIGATLAFLFSKILPMIEKKLYGDIFILGAVILLYGFSEQLGGMAR